MTFFLLRIWNTLNLFTERRKKKHVLQYGYAPFSQLWINTELAFNPGHTFNHLWPSDCQHVNNVNSCCFFFFFLIHLTAKPGSCFRVFFIWIDETIMQWVFYSLWGMFIFVFTLVFSSFFTSHDFAFNRKIWGKKTKKNNVWWLILYAFFSNFVRFVPRWNNAQLKLYRVLNHVALVCICLPLWLPWLRLLVCVLLYDHITVNVVSAFFSRQ